MLRFTVSQSGKYCSTSWPVCPHSTAAQSEHLLSVGAAVTHPGRPSVTEDAENLLGTMRSSFINFGGTVAPAVFPEFHNTLEFVRDVLDRDQPGSPSDRFSTVPSRSHPRFTTTSTKTLEISAPSAFYLSLGHLSYEAPLGLNHRGDQLALPPVKS